MNGASLLLEFCGFTLLALHMERHREQVFGDRPVAIAPFILAGAGWLLLLLATIPLIRMHGPSIGLAIWAGELTLAAVAVVLLNTYAPRLIPPLVTAAALTAALIAESPL